EWAGWQAPAGGEPAAQGSSMRAMSDRGTAHSVTEAGHRGPGGREETWTLTTAASAQHVVPSVRSRWHEPLRRGLALAPDPTPTAGAVELTDPDGDALTVTTDAQGTWITCTTVDGEVTAGPFPAAVLAKALAASARTAPPAARHT